MIILHYTGMKTAAAAEERLCDSASEVSSHYLVHEGGRVVQMVRESDRAWHAGKSEWRGNIDINSRSVGIEIVNRGHAEDYPAFPRRQIGAVVALCRDIILRHGIKPEMVLAHSDVAPGRKVDPGEKFPWGVLARAGVGRWVRPSRRQAGEAMGLGDRGEEVAALKSMLADYGYAVARDEAFDAATKAVVEAFQRHFRPAAVTGIADAATVETLRRLLAAAR